MVNHETVPWCTVVYYGICDTNVPCCTMVNCNTVISWYIMVLYHGLCINILAFIVLNIFIPIHLPAFQAGIA